MKCCKGQLPAILYLLRVEGFNPSLGFFCKCIATVYLLSSREALRHDYYVLNKHKLLSHPIRIICSIDSIHDLPEYLQGKCISPQLGIGGMSRLFVNVCTEFLICLLRSISC